MDIRLALSCPDFVAIIHLVVDSSYQATNLSDCDQSIEQGFLLNKSPQNHMKSQSILHSHLQKGIKRTDERGIKKIQPIGASFILSSATAVGTILLQVFIRSIGRFQSKFWFGGPII